MPACSPEWNERISARHDGEVSREERRRVDAHLAHCAGCAAAARSFTALGRTLRASAGATTAPRRAAGRAGSRARGRALAVAAGLLAAGAVGFVAARLQAGRALDGGLAADLVRVHLHSFARAEPCELGSSDPARVAGWLEASLGYRVEVPAVPGATLLGARRCNVAGVPSAHLLYRVGDHPLTVVIPPSGSAVARSTARFAADGPRCTAGPLGEGICVVPQAAQTALAVSDVATPVLLSLLEPGSR